MVVLISVFFVFVWAALSYKYARVLCSSSGPNRPFPACRWKDTDVPLARGSMQWVASVVAVVTCAVAVCCTVGSELPADHAMT